MEDPSEQPYGGPVYGEELDAVMDLIEENCNRYKTSELADAEIVREDFCVGMYWDHEDEEKFVLVTAYNENRAYFSVGASNQDRSEEITEIGFVDLEKLKPHLEAAGSTAESMDAPL